MNITKQKNELNELYEEQKSIEQTIERTAQLYRQTQHDRRELVCIWRKAVAALNSRESAIRETMQVSVRLKPIKHKNSVHPNDAKFGSQLGENRIAEILKEDAGFRSFHLYVK